MAITFRRMDLPTLRWTLRSSCKSRIRLLIDSLWPLAALTRLPIIADKYIRLQALAPLDLRTQSHVIQASSVM